MIVMEQMIPFISQVGFPIFISVFVLTKVTTTLDGVKDALTDLKIVIEKNNDGE